MCSTESDWYDLWLNLEQMVPQLIDCWVDNVKLVYDSDTRTTRNTEGVETRIPGFGNTSTVEYLDTSQRFYSVYFADLVKELVNLGYERGVNLHGAPYDFRKAANEHHEFFRNFKVLVEDAYFTNNKTKVILMTHSMGCPMVLYFLNRQPQSWKDKFIRSLVTLAGPWGGAGRAIQVFAEGEDFGAWMLLDKKKIMRNMRTNPALTWLMPTKQIWGDEVLIETELKNYTTSNYREMFEDFLEPHGWYMREDTENLTSDLIAPKVEVYCVHGSEVLTMEKMIYQDGIFPGVVPTEVWGDGDGTVNTRSLEACTKWRKEQEDRVYHHVLKGASHLGMLREPKHVSFITNIVDNINDDLNNFNTIPDQHFQSVFPRIDVV